MCLHTASLTWVQWMFSTQCKIRSPVDLKDLPYFIDIESEGRTYRTFLIVPGRPSVCFDCGRSGHMKNGCPGVQPPKSSSKIPSSPIQIPAKKPAHDDDHHSVDSNISNSVPLLDASTMFDNFQMAVCGSLQRQMSTLQHLHTKYRLVIRRGSKTTIISRKGVPIEVPPLCHLLSH